MSTVAVPGAFNALVGLLVAAPCTLSVPGTLHTHVRLVANSSRAMSVPGTLQRAHFGFFIASEVPACKISAVAALGTFDTNLVVHVTYILTVEIFGAMAVSGTLDAFVDSFITSGLVIIQRCTMGIPGALHTDIIVSLADVFVKGVIGTVLFLGAFHALSSKLITGATTTCRVGQGDSAITSLHFFDCLLNPVGVSRDACINATVVGKGTTNAVAHDSG